MADSKDLVKTNSYGFFGYVVPGVVVTLYLITVISYIRYGDSTFILAEFHQVESKDHPIATSSAPYEYISFLLVSIVCAYIIGHLCEACAQMIYDRFYMRRIYGHRLRQLILDEGTDRKETNKNFYRAAIASLYITAFAYLLAIAINGQGFRKSFLGNAAIAFAVIVVLACLTGLFWWFEGAARRKEAKARDYLKDCEAMLGVVDDILRGETETSQDRETLGALPDLSAVIPADADWKLWLRQNCDPLETHLADAAHYLNGPERDLFAAKEALQRACRRMRQLKSRNTWIVKVLARFSVVAEIITNKFIDDERPISRQVKAAFHKGLKKALDLECHPSLGSEVNRLPMWFIVEYQKDLSGFIVKYRSQAAMMCNISGAFLLCTMVSVFAFKGEAYDRNFAIMGIATLFISMFTSLRYFHVHDNDYVKTLIYAFVIVTTRLPPDIYSQADRPAD